MNDIFLKEIRPGSTIQPITTMSINELQEILPYFASNEISWAELLQFRFNGRQVGPYSVHQGMYDIRRFKNVPSRRNQAIRAEFDKVWSIISARYKAATGPTEVNP
jgi:hypothetical protein